MHSIVSLRLFDIMFGLSDISLLSNSFSGKYLLEDDGAIKSNIVPIHNQKLAERF